MEPNSGGSSGRASEKQGRPSTSQASNPSSWFAATANLSFQIFLAATLALAFLVRDVAASAGGFVFRKVHGMLASCAARVRAALEEHVPIIRPPHASSCSALSLNSNLSNNGKHKSNNGRKIAAERYSNDGAAIAEATNDATLSQLQPQQRAWQSPRALLSSYQHVEEATQGFSNDGGGSVSGGKVSRVKGGNDGDEGGNDGDGDGNGRRNSRSANDKKSSNDFDPREAKAALLPTKVHAIGSRYSSFARTLRFWGGGGSSRRSNSTNSSSSHSSVDSDGSGGSNNSGSASPAGDNETAAARAVRLQTTPSRSRLPSISASRRHSDSTSPHHQHHSGSGSYGHSRSGNTSSSSSSSSNSSNGRAGDHLREVHNLPPVSAESANSKQHLHHTSTAMPQYSSSVVDLSPLGSPLLRTPYARSPTLSPPSQPFCSPTLSPPPPLPPPTAVPECHHQVATVKASSSCTRTSPFSSSLSPSPSSSAHIASHHVVKLPTPAPIAKLTLCASSSSSASVVRAAAAWATSSSSHSFRSCRKPKSTTCTIEEGDEEAESTPPNCLAAAVGHPTTNRATAEPQTETTATAATTAACVTTNPLNVQSNGKDATSSANYTESSALASKNTKKSGSNNKKASKTKSRRNAQNA